CFSASATNCRPSCCACPSRAVSSRGTTNRQSGPGRQRSPGTAPLNLGGQTATSTRGSVPPGSTCARAGTNLPLPNPILLLRRSSILGLDRPDALPRREG